jgi:hypothetical protein
MSHTENEDILAIPADRWLEIDLHWFNREQLEQSVAAFWERYTPLYRGVSGWKGIIINVGWLMDYVLDWRGDLNQLIPIVRNMKLEKFIRRSGPLKGSIMERMHIWKQHFAYVDAETVRYPDWSYGDLQTLCTLLRQQAKAGGLGEVKVGSLVLGWQHIYGGSPSNWSSRHPQAFYRVDWFRQTLFNPTASLEDDSTAYAAYPQGVQQGLPIIDFFAAQWGHLSRTVGLDAIILRDSLIGSVPYLRRGPFGNLASPDPAQNLAWHQATADLVRLTKQANPEALVIGYSNAASAVADWRANCVDLEAIALEGYLDAWIDQTWAGAWNEVGVRQRDFWNSPWLGWTYQLTYVLTHAAILARTRVRHYVLIETFDAWESWETIHTAPERLRWGIWAYHHAAVKLPEGLKMPAGTYISWGNQFDQLLTVNEVDFLRQNINAAVVSAAQTSEVLGPTLVYSRSAMSWQNRHAPEVDIKEWIDEHVGTLMKWGLPVLSAARLEDLFQIRSDLPLLQTPVHLAPAEQEHLLNRLNQPQPLMVIGNPSGGIDPTLAQKAGLWSQGVIDSSRHSVAQALENVISQGLPKTFAIIQPWTQNIASPHAEVLYSVSGSPALTRWKTLNKNVLVWDPPELSTQNPPQVAVPLRVDLPVRDRLGSVYPYVLTARAVHTQLREAGCLHLEPQTVEAQFPVSVLAWRKQDNSLCLLVAELEEGIADHTSGQTQLGIHVPQIGQGWQVQAVHSDPEVRLENGVLWVEIAYSQCHLLHLTESQ